MPESIVVLSVDDCLISENGNVDGNYYKSLAWLAGYIRGANVRQYPRVCLCSEKSAVFTEAISFLIGWPHFPTIVEDGAAFFDTLTKELKTNPEIPEKTLAVLNAISRKMAPLILKRYPVLAQVTGHQVNVAFLKKNIESMLTMESIRKGIRTFIPRLIKKRILKTVVSGNCISIAPAGVNKGTAVEALAKEKGLDLKQCIGIGSLKSDIFFLEKTGLVGCPQNADSACREFVKGKNGKVSQYSFAEGAADVIKWFLQLE